MRKNKPAPLPQGSDSIRRVAVLVDTSTSWGRGIIAGIQQYALARGNWHLFVEARGLHDSTALPRDWQGDGIIARIGTPEVAAQLRRRRIPVVNVSGIRLPGKPFPCVCNDGEAVARMAAEYFLTRGFRHFAYLSLRGLEYVARQCAAYQKAVAAAGCECAVHGVKANSGFISPDWNLHIGELGAWLASLPKPVAVLTWGGGREVILACLRVGIRVPQEVAVLSSSDDDLLCGIGPVHLSGVKNACEKIGSEAAAMLDQAMQGNATPEQAVLVPPLGVVTRQSTDTLAITDDNLVSALAFINRNLSTGIQIQDVARAAGISRRALELRFAKTLGTSPGTYLTRARLDLVRKLLVETDMQVGELSERAGFCSPEYMTTVFRREFSTTPLRYRKDMRDNRG
jgi:LacI family transcriptional regulator